MYSSNGFSNVKDYITDKFYDFSDAVDLDDKVTKYKRKLTKAKNDFNRNIAQLKNKKVGSLFDFGKKDEKKLNPFIAFFFITGGLLLAFSLMVAFFYGVFYILDKKKKDGYFTVKF